MTHEEKRWMALGQAVERACRELPRGSDLHLELACGEGKVALHSPNEDGTGLRNWEGDTLAAQIHMALAYANSMARFATRLPEPNPVKMDAFQRLVRRYIGSAVEFPMAFLTSGAVWEDKDPLDVMFYWEEPGFGEIARFNLRDDLIEAFTNDPNLYGDRLAKTEKALRDLADQLAALPRSAA